MIEHYSSDCPLCRLAQDREILTRLVTEDELLIVVDCLICQTPMAVLKAHRPNFTEDEVAHVKNVFRQLSREGVIDWEQRRIPDHAHCHLRQRPFPGTKNWEKF